jgi:autotransporter-associated beta strand protein
MKTYIHAIIRAIRATHITRIACLLACGTSALFATDYTWDPDATTSGTQYGNGIWDTTTANWTTDGGTTHGTWNNSTGTTNNASFPSAVSGTAPGQVVVTLGADINLQQIGMGGSYDANVLVTGNGYTLNFSGGSQLLANNSSTNKTLQIDAVIATGGNILKGNQGIVVLSQDNTWTGGITINAGTLQIGAGGTTGTLGAGTVVNNAALTINRSDNYTITNVISGTGTFAKTGAGTAILSGENTYTGQTTIWAGVIRLGGNERIANTSNLRLSGQSTFATGGFRETLGTLALINNATAIIDFGNDGTDSTLTFADSSSVTWSGTLELRNFTVGKDTLRFGTSASGLTQTQLDAITLAGYTAISLDADGYVVFSAAVPEPSTCALLFGGTAALLLIALRLRCRQR